MSRMSNGHGGHVEIDYDKDHDQTHWKEWYDDGSFGGGGTESGDKRGKLEDHFEDHGFRKEGHSG